MAVIREFDCVKTLIPVSGRSLNGKPISFPAGELATVIDVYDTRGYELEFYWDNPDGSSDAFLVSILPEQIIPCQLPEVS